MKIKLGDPILRAFDDAQLQRLSRRELIVLARGEQKIRQECENYILELEARSKELENLAEEMKERVLEVEGALARVRTTLFEPSSERSPAPRRPDNKKGNGRKKGDKVKRLPSERYPDAPIIEKHITLENPPHCSCCGQTMEDTGLVETSEHLTVIPKRYLIVRENKHKYSCMGCHGGMASAPALPRVIPGGSYSDEMICDATLSKYLDLIPMERYCQIAARQGFPGLPPQSLISASFKLAKFLLGLYTLIQKEVLAAHVLLADETPHRMLEGDPKKHWYLWGFSSEHACFYEFHDTRSGEVASRVLAESNCRFLLTDVYSGYKRAVREANAKRAEQGKPLIEMAFCNAHARREFFAPQPTADAQFMLDHYKAIYALQAQAKDQSLEIKYALRSAMRPHFEAMLEHAKQGLEVHSSKSQIGKGYQYFINNYAGLTLCLNHPEIPLDNNASERHLRSPVVGRKTWYGTHSLAGAEAAATHFTIIESCKLNGINPRTFYPEIIRRLHDRQDPLSPHTFATQPPQPTPTESS